MNGRLSLFGRLIYLKLRGTADAEKPVPPSQSRKLFLGNISLCTVFDTIVVVESSTCAISLIVLNRYTRAILDLSKPVYKIKSQ